MSVAYWIAAGYMTVNCLYGVFLTGKPREPRTGGEAVEIVITGVFVVAVLVRAAIEARP